MSHSLLSSLEACPRQWALANGSYAAMWGGKGYPRPFEAARIEGVIIHSALETIVAALLEARCTSSKDPSAPGVLRSLGGFTKILQKSLDRVLTSFKDNPRAAPGLERARAAIGGRIQDLRARLQFLLARIELKVGEAKSKTAAAGGRGATALQPGSYAEQYLEAPTMAWCGIADLLIVSEGGCEIRDFKTGAHKPTHSEQLETYALLWARDSARNPSGLKVARLIVSYPDRDEEVASPQPDRLNALERDLISRTASARQAVSNDPPPAITDPSRCPRCHVRHLCQDYWERRQGVDAIEGFRDLAVRVVERLGETTWKVVVETEVTHGAVLRGVNASVDFAPSERLRILNAWCGVDEGDGETLYASLVSSTEVYRL